MSLQLKPLKFNLPQIISEFPLIHQIGSFSFSENYYEVNLQNYTCNCPNWTEERSNFIFPDIRRACKHISSFLIFHPFHWVLPVPPSNYRLATVNIEKYRYALIQKESYWIDILVLNPKQQIYDYGYNISEKRWAYKTTPKHSKYIRPLIFKWIESNVRENWRIEID